jgi:CheY-like chemotaxis protein
MEMKEMTDSTQSTKGKILLMDDDDIVLEITSRMLESYGYTAVSAKDGEEAVQKYRQALDEAGPFDVVILDLTVRGGIGGLGAIKEILALDSAAKVVISSGYSNDPTLLAYKEYGFCGVMTKPYRLKRLKEDLEEIIGAKES